MRGERGYDDPCGIARGLDLVGERWALLVVRELLFGPKRFTDLRRGLHGASQNVLSQRLRQLEQAGVLTRRRLGPPVSTQVYELTERGRELEPVLFHLARWGGRVPLTTETGLGLDAMMFALKTTFDPAAAGELRARYELRIDDDVFRAVLVDGELDLARCAVDRPDATITAGSAVFRSLVFARRALNDAQRSGDAQVTGDFAAMQRFLGLFPRPAT